MHFRLFLFLLFVLFCCLFFSQTEALVMMGALDVLHRLFGAEGRAVAAVRSAGLSALNAAEPLKRRLARHAMGGGT